MDLAREVSRRQLEAWSGGKWQLGEGYGHLENPKYHVVAFDYGVKNNILRMLAERGCKVTVVPAQTPAAAVRKLDPDGGLPGGEPLVLDQRFRLRQLAQAQTETRPDSQADAVSTP